MNSRCLCVALGGLMMAALTAPTVAAPLPVTSAAVQPADNLLIKTQVARRRAAVAGPRGVAVRRTTVVRGPRGGVAVGRTTAVRGWARPRYRWGPGGAIAAGAAIGVIAAGTAIAFAGQPPAPGLCWYYTDPSQQQGFWDQCPPQ